MKKVLPTLVFMLVVCGFFPSKGFSYYENKMYCRLSQNSVVISLNNKDGQLCNRYIRSLELSMKDAYIDILAIQKYIDKKNDLGYWKPLKDEKAVYLNSLQSVRLNIIAHMKSFEQSLLVKSKEYFMQSISLYRKQLTIALSKIKGFSDTHSMVLANQIMQQLSYIQNMADAETFEIFSINLQKYLYLKQQLVGK